MENKIQWHRVSGTEYVDPNIHANRAFLYPTPVLREDIGSYFDYDIDERLAVSLSLFTKPSSPPTYPECMCKQAVWFAKHLCMHTDMPEAGVPLFLGIAEDTRDVALPYLQACNFPMERVFFTQGDERSQEWITKYETLWSGPMKDFQRVMHMDVCYLIGRYPTQRVNPLFSQIKEMWHAEKMITCSAVIQRGNPGEIHPIQVRLQHHWGNPEDVEERRRADDDYWHFVATQLDSTPEAERDYWVCNSDHDLYLFRGGIYGFQQAFLDESFQHYIRDLLRFFNCDEAAMALYAKKHHWGDQEILDVGDAFRWTSLDYPQTPHYGPKSFMYYSRGDDPDFWLAQHTQQ